MLKNIFAAIGVAVIIKQGYACYYNYRKRREDAQAWRDVSSQ